jgi:hypothetical protein
MTVDIVNIHRAKADFYCGRGSALGNPFVLEDSRSVKQRDEVCDQYHTYFIEEVLVKQNRSMLKELSKIKRTLVEKKRVTLGCFCTPRRCHCETIKSYLMGNLKIN